jgi:hypothetical protein
MIEQGGLAKAQSAALNASTDDYAPRERNCDRRGGAHSRDPLANPGKIL